MFRVTGWGTDVGGAYPNAVVRVDGRDIGSVTVTAPQNKPKTFEVRGKLDAGEGRVSVAFTNPHEDKKAGKFREFGVDRLEIEGPFDAARPAEPRSVKLLLVARPGDGLSDRDAAMKVLANFARRAYRRPLRDGEINRLMALYDMAAGQGEPFPKAVALPMKAVLVSPNFLFRVEADPDNPDAVRTLNDHEFATRLSYFLWSSMPDEELFGLAERGVLRNPGVLDAQVKRMLADPKAAALGENFAGQWLQLRDLATFAPDASYYPKWDDDLRDGMAGEARAFFEYVRPRGPERSGLPRRRLRDRERADGEALRHPRGVRPRVPQGEAARRPPRRGRHDGQHAHRHLEPDPDLAREAGQVDFRERPRRRPVAPAPGRARTPADRRVEGHPPRADGTAPGEPELRRLPRQARPARVRAGEFRRIGGWRATDNKKPIDASGVLPDGASFDGPAGLRKVLLGKADQFRHCFAEKLLTFALGRGLDYYDACAVEEITAAGKANGDRFSALVLAIVTSDPFQKRKGKRSE